VAPDEDCYGSAEEGDIENKQKRPVVMGEGSKQGGHAADEDEEPVQRRIEPERFHDAIIQQWVSGIKLIEAQKEALP
jgi:hypothetical protein